MILFLPLIGNGVRSWRHALSEEAGKRQAGKRQVSATCRHRHGEACARMETRTRPDGM
jgi:hypothetical protein